MRRCRSIAMTTILVLSAAACLYGAPASAVQQVNESRPVAANAAVEITNIAGEIAVTGWDRNEVQITGTLDDELELKITGGGERLDIEVEYPKHMHGELNLSADLEVRVPRAADLDLSSVSADLTVGEFTGPLRAESVSGDIHAEGRMKELELHTVSGEIDSPASAARVTIEAISSDVRLGPFDPRENAEVMVQTVSGDVTLDGSPAEADVESVSGDVLFQGEVQADGRYEFTSHSGDIRLALPVDTSAQFTVSTFSGDISNELGSGHSERTSRYTPGSELQLTLGGGNARVRVETFSGDVTLTRR